ncbi:MAG: hypothetical protein HW386_1848 [Gammaproteobacteria bacterium]|nr:hypothetical protein [Gammaproteobacteria bacterium]
MSSTRHMDRLCSGRNYWLKEAGVIRLTRAPFLILRQPIIAINPGQFFGYPYVKFRFEEWSVFDRDQADINFFGLFFLSVSQAGAAYATKPASDSGRGYKFP